MLLTAARFGSVPATSQQQPARFALYAQDAGSPGAARYLQVCQEIEQPQHGTREVLLQVSGSASVCLRITTSPCFCSDIALQGAMGARSHAAPSPDMIAAVRNDTVCAARLV